MKVRLTIGWLVVLMLVAAIGYAQAPAAARPVMRLSLAEALDIAVRNNPDYRQTLNDRGPAGLRSTSAFVSLLTPSADISANRYHSSAGQRNFPGFPSQTVPALTSTSWSFGLGYRLSLQTISNRGWAAAQLRATDEDIAGARTLLETSVRTEYLNLLQAQAQADLSRRSLERVNEQLNLARARYAVGQATLIDVRRAEVDKGQAEVNLLTTNLAVENQVLVLFQRLGVPAPDPLAVQPTDTFPVVAPPWSQDSLVSYAQARNPGLRSLRARQESARWNVRSATSQFLPSLSFSAGYGKYSQSQAGTTTSGANPWNYSIGVSLPLFEGMSRNVAVSEARAAEDDLRQMVRSRELDVRASVVSAYNALLVAFRTIELQTANKAAAAEALELASQRYRVGSGTYLELLDARLAADRADADFVNAVYNYHKSIAALENAVGRPLR